MCKIDSKLKVKPKTKPCFFCPIHLTSFILFTKMSFFFRKLHFYFLKCLTFFHMCMYNILHMFFEIFFPFFYSRFWFCYVISLHYCPGVEKSRNHYFLVLWFCAQWGMGMHKCMHEIHY